MAVRKSRKAKAKKGGAKGKVGVRARLRDPVREALANLIVTGELRGGEKLNEARLAALLNTSRTPLREALLHLEREGLVRSDLRRGFSVTPLSSDEVREIYPILAQLEGMAVRDSAAFIPALLPELVQINAEFAATRAAKRALELDTLWHDTLMSRSRNARLAAMVERLRVSIRRYEHVYMADPKLRPLSVAQHKAILAALRRGDIDASLKAIAENYRFGMEALLRMMDGS